MKKFGKLKKDCCNLTKTEVRFEKIKTNFETKLNNIKTKWEFAAWGLDYDLKFTIGSIKLGALCAVPVTILGFAYGYGVVSLLMGIGATLPFVAYGLIADAILYYDEMYF